MLFHQLDAERKQSYMIYDNSEIKLEMILSERNWNMRNTIQRIIGF